MAETTDGKTVYFRIGIWYDEDSGEIRVQSDEAESFMASVSRDPDSRHGDPSLYDHLAKVLRGAGAKAP